MLAASVSEPSRPQAPSAPWARRASFVLPDAVCATVLRVLDRLAGWLASLGVSANAITATCIALGAAAGICLAQGWFAMAAAAMVIASLGDALDGLVARRSGTVSVAGALLDAAGDRYQEFFFLGGMAVLERGSLLALIIALFAMAGCFMVSYGSAKAEAFGVPVPSGWMRRPERAVCMCVAAGLEPPWAWMARTVGFPAWAATLPLVVATALIAAAANVSAVRRLRAVARVHALGEPPRRPL